MIMKNFAAKFCMSMAVVVAMTVGTTQSLATDLNRSIKDTQPYTGAAAHNHGH